MEIMSPKALALRPGTDREILAVLEQSKSVWGHGISLEEYVEYHNLIRNHPWSRKNFQHLVLIDDQGEIFSSCKVYHHRVRIGSEFFPLAGIGAVFTPPPYRGLNYASQMLEYLMDEIQDQGFELALLFTDIGPEFYSRFGFRLFFKSDPVYLFEEQGRASPEIQILNHLPAELMEWDQAYDQGRNFVIVKNPEYFQLLSDRMGWHQKFLGYHDQKAAVSFSDQTYLWADLSRWRLTVRRFGTRASDPALALGRLLAGLKAQLGFNSISGWLPAEFEQYPFLRLKESEPRTRSLMMLTALTERADKIYRLTPEEIQFWLADYF